MSINDVRRYHKEWRALFLNTPEVHEAIATWQKAVDDTLPWCVVELGP